MMVEARKICQIDSEININNAFVEEENTHISFFFLAFPPRLSLDYQTDQLNPTQYSM